MKEINKLKMNEAKIRRELDNLIGIDNPIYSPIWKKINELVENEIEQEKLCNQ